MSGIPPIGGPKLPPAIKPQKKENICIIHRGPPEGKIYKCEKCGAIMCYSCAVKRKYEENKPFCPACSGFLFVKKSELE